MSDAPDPAGPVDPRFARARDSARTRRRRQSLRRHLIIGLVGAALAGGLVAGGLLVGPGLLSRLAEIPRAQGPAPPTPEMAAETVAPPDETARADPPPQSGPQSAPRFIDLPGKPLRIEAAPRAQSAPPRYLTRPDGLPPGRGEGRVLVIRDTMVPPGERLNVSLPTSQEDFAIFQAQRRTAARPEPSVATASKPADGLRLRPRNVAEAHALIAHHAAGRQTAQTGPARTFGAAALRLRPPEERRKLHEESILRIARAAPTEQILIREGLTEEDARIVARAARDHLGLDRLDSGHVIALRWQGPVVVGQGSRRHFAQAAFYGPDRYLGSLARGRGDEAGGQDPAGDPAETLAGDPAETLAVTTGADPWIDRDFSALMEGAPAAQAVSQPAGGKLRIMDGLYGAALRQGLPPRLVGQMIMLLAEAHELDAEASESDRITLVLSERPPDGAGRDSDSEARLLDQVLFIGIEGDHKVHCYVHRPAPDSAPTCYGMRDGRAPARGVAGGTAGGAASDSMIDGAGAVEQLVNRIIQVESAGKTDARNPRSTATGLGQFIDRTWLRMMRTYRPDLTAQMSDAELLDLRTEPRIAREMVTNLAREGAAFLRARGHAITAGRLYLAHFLGMQGAHAALTAEPDTDLLSLFGAGVISANPFLKGRDAGYVVQWAEAKMSGASGRITVIREPDGLNRFRGLVDELLGTG